MPGHEPGTDGRRRDAANTFGTAGPAAMRILFTLLLVLSAMTGTGAEDGIRVEQLPLEGWRLVTDGVMGGLSQGELLHETRLGRPGVCLRGQVSTRNNGGFVQIALDLDRDAVTAARMDGIGLRVIGNGEAYNVHLRTSYLWLPWQSYRATFETSTQWQEILLPFETFEPYKTSTPLDPAKIRRIGIVAIGREFEADVCIAEPAFYRAVR